MSAFPWESAENDDMQRQRSEYAASLKANVEQRQQAMRDAKEERKRADLADDAKIARESEAAAQSARGAYDPCNYYTRAQRNKHPAVCPCPSGELDRQRAREALVARREAFGAQQRDAQEESSREAKIDAYQRTLVGGTSACSSLQLGGDGLAEPTYQRSARGLAPVVQSSAHAEAEAGLARAAASGDMRPDQQADFKAAEIKKRAQGGGLW